MSITTRELRKEDIVHLADFPPKEWNLDITGIFNFFYGDPCFRCILAVDDGIIAGVSACYLNKDSAWLGQIIVREEYRQHGVGLLVTKEMVDYSKSRGCRRILLTATPLGKILYKKLGFREITDYIFYKRESLMDKPVCSRLMEFSPGDFEAVCRLDLKITGEDRSNILKMFCRGGIVYRENDKIEGYYFDHFGNGAVVAENSTAGLALLQYKHSRIKAVSVCPAENTSASEFLSSNGFSESSTGTRMILGDDFEWKPECIYSRMAAYLG